MTELCSTPLEPSSLFEGMLRPWAMMGEPGIMGMYNCVVEATGVGCCCIAWTWGWATAGATDNIVATLICAIP
eukprot:15367006-Ditylum_brightwellii.AAC.1